MNFIKSLPFFLVLTLSGCGAFYLALLENRSGEKVVVHKKGYIQTEHTLQPGVTKEVGWDDVCQRVTVGKEEVALDTRNAPVDSFSPGRNTPGRYRVLFSENKFYYYVSEKKMVEIPIVAACPDD